MRTQGDRHLFWVGAKVNSTFKHTAFIKGPQDPKQEGLCQGPSIWGQPSKLQESTTRFFQFKVTFRQTGAWPVTLGNM